MPTPRLKSTALAAAIVSTAMPALAHPEGGYGDLVEKVAPAVVFIEVTSDVTPAAANEEAEEFFREFQRRFGDRFGRQFPNVPEFSRPGPRRGVGSGFIISEDGKIITNHHVVDGAETVTVRMSDGDEFEATVVGSDELTDIALLQIETDETLPMVELGDSDQVRVGDSVVAVGSPFGLGGTVTSGIVSATSRNINSGPFDDFIQTDAAINRGNSGGPLFNEEGEVIGVNTAIFSPRGGSVGIGFAVPSEIVEDVVADLSDDGKIERGWLGVQFRPMTDEVASVLGYDEPTGAVVEEVFEGSPADEAGLMEGDIILKMGEKDIETVQDLPRAVARMSPNSEVMVTVLRKGEEVTLDVTIGLRAPQDT